MTSAMTTAIGIGMTGALGAATRYLLVEWVALRWRKPFPLATFVINISGSFALGFLTTAFAAAAGLETRLLLGTGFLGGYTTFSALSFETVALARRGESAHAWLYVGGSVVAGVVAAMLGMALGLTV